MKTTRKDFERIKPSRCRQCGNCCRNLILEITGTDLMREPRLAEYSQRMKDIDYRNWEAELDQVIFLLPSPCPFLKDNQCSIYPTRPNLCVVFRAVHNERCAASPKCVFNYKFAGA